MKKNVLAVALALMASIGAYAEKNTVSSPDGKLNIVVEDRDGKLYYSIDYAGKRMMEESQLGLLANVGDFSQGLTYQGKNEIKVEKSYASELANQYASQLNFRNGILVAGIVTMIIALFGLVGYTSDEVNRRRKEIAIRKVNGAKVKDILRIFLKDIMKIALPCIIVGDLGAWLIARQWLMSFSEKITMTPLLFIGVTIILLVIIGLSVIINCYKVANSNPVKYLKDE